MSSGSTFASFFAGGSQNWELTTLGNWKKTIVDANGDGVLSANNTQDAIDTRTHNFANEITVRTYEAGGVSTPINPTNDNNGNLLTKPRVSGTDNYVYDAWNRLVTHTLTVSATTTTLANFEYNGLHQRTRATVTPAAAGTENRAYYYDASWRLVQEHVTRYTTSAAAVQNYIVQQFYGVRGSDDALVRRVKMPSPASTTVQAATFNWNFAAFTNTSYYQLTDAQWSVRATLKIDPANPTVKQPVHEYVEYDAYGKPTHRYAADVDRSGVVDAADQALLTPLLGKLIDQTGYNADYDLDRNGVINAADQTLIGNMIGRVAAPSGSSSDSYIPNGTGTGMALVPGPDSVISYCGYVNHPRSSMLLARHRWYQPSLGRWQTRDPAGYVDGFNLYAYVGGNPLSRWDPSGLAGENASSRYTYDIYGQGNNRYVVETKEWIDRSWVTTLSFGLWNRDKILSKEKAYIGDTVVTSAGKSASEMLREHDIGQSMLNTADASASVQSDLIRFGDEALDQGVRAGNDQVAGGITSAIVAAAGATKVVQEALEAVRETQLAARTTQSGKGSVNVSGAANPKPKPNAEQAAPCTPGPTVVTVTNDVPDPASMRKLSGLERQRDYAKELRGKGMDVVERGKAEGPDYLVNGKPLEYTTVNSNGKNTIIHSLEGKLSLKDRPAGPQARILHVDARWSGQSSEAAQHALELGKNKGYFDNMDEVHIITDNGTIIWRRGE